LGYSSSARRRITFVQEQKSLRSYYYSSPESFKRFGECCVYRVTSTMETAPFIISDIRRRNDMSVVLLTLLSCINQKTALIQLDS